MLFVHSDCCGGRSATSVAVLAPERTEAAMSGALGQGSAASELVAGTDE